MLESEDRLLNWLRRIADREGEPLLGDDAAVLPLDGGIAVTVDQQIEGIHFLAGLDAAVLGRRLVRVNISDLAAMGAEPTHGLLALAAPDGFDHRRFFRGLVAECDRFGLRLAGGDLARADSVRLALTLLGRRTGRWLRRDAARPGDALWIGGTLGESAAGCRLLAQGATFDGRRVTLPESLALGGAVAGAARRAVRRHLLPEPQLELSAWLSARRRVAAIDVSDGLARDLHRLCRESGAGAEIDRTSLPLAARAVELASELGGDAVDWALHGGEDYVLLFASPEADEPPARYGCTRLGSLTASGSVRMKTGGASRPLSDVGFDHLAGAASRGVRPPANDRRGRRGHGAPRRPRG